MFSTNRPLYDAFLARNDDNNVDIRQLVVRGCATIIEYHSESNNQIFRKFYDNKIYDKYKTLINIILFLEILKERIADTNEIVRAESVEIICKIAERDLKIVSVELLEQVANRFIDVKAHVRCKTFECISLLYNNIDPEDYDEDEYNSKINWIPKKIICCYHYSNWQVRYNVEKVLSEALLPNEIDEDDEDDLESIRAATLLDIILTFIDEPPVLAAHEKLLKEKFK